jgi:hypothetical protein
MELWIPAIFWILMNLAVIFDAGGDALDKRKKWIVSKIYQIIVILCFASMIYIASRLPQEFKTWQCWVNLGLSYIFIRIGLFNAAWGIFRFRYCYWWYLGKTSLWDKFLIFIFKSAGNAIKLFLFLFYLIFWLVSAGVIIDNFYVIH